MGNQQRSDMTVCASCFIRGQVGCAEFVFDRLDSQENLIYLVRVALFVHGNGLLTHKLHQFPTNAVGGHVCLVAKLGARVLLVRREVYQTRVPEFRLAASSASEGSTGVF